MLLSLFPVCFVPVILPLIKVLLGSKHQARNFLDKYKNYATLHVHVLYYWYDDCGVQVQFNWTKLIGLH